MFQVRHHLPYLVHALIARQYLIVFLSLCIKPDGSIQPCQTLYDSYYSLGNIFQLDIASVEKNAQEMAGLSQQRLQMDYGCNRCLLREGCSKGCMAAAANLSGDPLQDDGECEYRKLIFLKQSLSRMKGN